MKLIHSINEFHNAKADVISKANMINGFAGMCFFTDPVTGYTIMLDVISSDKNIVEDWLNNCSNTYRRNRESFVSYLNDDLYYDGVKRDWAWSLLGSIFQFA